MQKQLLRLYGCVAGQMTQPTKRELETERLTQCLVICTLEKLAANLAAYLAAGVHQPAENGRQAVMWFLEGMADSYLDFDVGEGGDGDEAQSRALVRIGEIIMRIRAAAHL